jgi:hypothetical protein
MNPEVVQTALAEPAGGFSLLALFWQAHIVVKLVILGLVGASVWCWAIIVDKLLLYARTRRQIDHFRERLLVGAIAGRTLPAGLVQGFSRGSGAVRRRHEGVEAHL